MSDDSPFITPKANKSTLISEGSAFMDSPLLLHHSRNDAWRDERDNPDIAERENQLGEATDSPENRLRDMVRENKGDESDGDGSGTKYYETLSDSPSHSTTNAHVGSYGRKERRKSRQERRKGSVYRNDEDEGNTDERKRQKKLPSGLRFSLTESESSDGDDHGQHSHMVTSFSLPASGSEGKEDLRRNRRQDEKPRRRKGQRKGEPDEEEGDGEGVKVRKSSSGDMKKKPPHNGGKKKKRRDVDDSSSTDSRFAPYSICK